MITREKMVERARMFREKTRVDFINWATTELCKKMSEVGCVLTIPEVYLEYLGPYTCEDALKNEFKDLTFDLCENDRTVRVK